ncbi:ribonuclease T2 [Exophiala viscosa]|uniref:ribonuclease T2 n=1 Tax=Exophiala viscosa TaxID=2486360 RepID=A0AAN6DMV8_9EURO|nr:ribonuclease T2 [Exophiala viscosa]KAI1628350.1 ribonuclease T2 [Exophiala viscosa]
MASIKYAALAAALLSSAQASLYGESNVNHTCVLEPQILSCSSGANAATADTCCTETFGGLVLSTQYWQTYTGLESQGQLLPPNTWTLHGLWPDFCNGSYTQYCDLSRQFDPAPSPNTTNGLANGTVVPPYKGPGVDTFITNFSRYDLLNYMNTYWTNQGASNEAFWAHEFSKHATCYSTFDVPCYGPNYVQHQEVIEFYETAIKYYRRLPTWEWLNEVNITPSNTTQYTLSDIQGQLAKKYGATPYIGCSGPKYNATAAGKNSTDNGGTVVSEVWYYQHVAGRPQEGNSIPVNATTPNTTCAKAAKALWYYEMTPSSVRNTTIPARK